MWLRLGLRLGLGLKSDFKKINCGNRQCLTVTMTLAVVTSNVRPWFQLYLLSCLEPEPAS